MLTNPSKGTNAGNDVEPIGAPKHSATVVETVAANGRLPAGLMNANSGMQLLDDDQ